MSDSGPCALSSPSTAAGPSVWVQGKGTAAAPPTWHDWLAGSYTKREN